MRSSLTLEPVVESDSFEFLRNYAQAESLITFQIPIGLRASGDVPGFVARPVDERDTPAGMLYVGQLRSRSLPVAAARFADQISAVLQQRYAS